MKFISALLAVLAVPAAAFAPAVGRGRMPMSLASVTRPDTSAAIAAALEASRKYGAASPEARVAWDAVEEMDASDNTAAFEGSLDEECLTEEDISKACVEYGRKLDVLASLVDEYGPKLDVMKSLAKDMEAIKLTVADSKPSTDSPQMRAALKNAKEMTEKYGATSPESRIAWEEVEEIASSGLSNAMGARLDEECLVDTAKDACRALEELNRALNLQRSKGAGLNA